MARLTADNSDTVGKYNSIFTSIYGLGAIFGSIVGAVVFTVGGGAVPERSLIAKLLWALVGIQAVGVALFTLIM